MHPEALIIRRCHPVPVTFADLRAAYVAAYDVRWRFKSAFLREWHSMLKAQTGAIDEVYAVVDGREVRVAVVAAGESAEQIGWCGAWPANNGYLFRAMENLLIRADEQGYWERPHEVRLDLSPRPVSHGEVARAVLVGQEALERGGVVRS